MLLLGYWLGGFSVVWWEVMYCVEVKLSVFEKEEFVVVVFGLVGNVYFGCDIGVVEIWWLVVVLVWDGVGGVLLCCDDGWVDWLYVGGE